MKEQFRVWITFENDHRILDTDWSTAEHVLSSLQRLMHGPAAKLGIISEIRVVDMSDSSVFLMQDGKQVFPESAGAPRAQDIAHARASHA